MAQVDTPQAAPAANNFAMIRTMAGVGVLCALMIVFTYQSTLPVIQRNRAEALEAAIFQVLPGATSKRTYEKTANGTFQLLSGGETPGKDIVYAGYDQQGNLIGFALEARGQGFQDVISMIIGYSSAKQAVTGFRVLESKETPGLGDKIEKDAGFLQNFEALDVALTSDGSQIANPVIAVKAGQKSESWQVECITGATISSKAVSNIVRNASALWVPLLEKNREAFN